MHTLRIPALLSSGLLFATACAGDEAKAPADAEPTVEIAADPLSGEAPLEVALRAVAEGGDGPLVFTWDFGDGGPGAIGAEVRHTFEAGTHAVKVRAEDADGDVAEASATVEVAAAPTLVVTATPSTGVVPVEVAFTATPSFDDAASYAWTFGDGGTSDEAAPGHTYDRAGTYTARLVVTREGGGEVEASVTVVAELDLQPGAEATAEVPDEERPLEVLFSCTGGSGNAPLSYAWEFGDGETASVADVLHAYGAPGLYEAKCVVTDRDGDAAEAPVSVDLRNAEPELAIDAPWCVMAGEAVTLDASKSSDPEGQELAFSWSFLSRPLGSAATLTDADTAVASFVPDVDGRYELQLVVSDGTYEVVSKPQRIDVNSTPMLRTVGGNLQRAPAGAAFAEAVSISATTACGPMVGRTFRFRGLGLSPDAASAVTNDDGVATVGIHAGERAGDAYLLVESEYASMRVAATITPGDPAYVIVEAPPDAEAGKSVSVAFQVADEFGNPIDDRELTFDVSLEDAAGTAVGSFDAVGGPSVLTGATTASGRLEKTIHNSAPGALHVVVTPADAGIEAVGRASFLKDGFEEADDGWELTGDWDRGTPTSGPFVAHGGTKVLATNVGGDHSVGAASVARRQVEVPAGAIAAWVDAWQYWDTAVEDGCALAGGWMGFGAELAPAEGWPGPALCDRATEFPDGTVSGSGGEWLRLHLPLGAGADWLSFEFEATAAATPLAGWYLDDLEVWGLLPDAVIDYAIGTPALAVGTMIQNGDDCGGAAIVEAQVADAGGNALPLSVPVYFEVDGLATIGNVLVGTLDSRPDAQRALVYADASGKARVEVENTVVEWNTVTTMLDNVAGSDTYTSVDFTTACAP